ncbi:hypothetical protein IWX65_002190 [Arthrobacter sp. CAN_A214]|uniref:hypothetical protein n=1 Tax=Arthrobacter sp. CAN_A214 TaxID=2787720 RepID=UPI0018C8F0F4
MTKQQVEHDAGGTGGSTANPADARTGSGEHPKQEHRPSGPFGPSDAVVGPFTLREAVFGGAVLLVFIGTLIPFARDTISYQNFWTISPLFYVGLGILLPVAAAALLASRRLGTATLRVGSLSVDQFASVSAVLASVFFFLETVTFFQAGALVSLIGALGMLVATVFAPHLPPLNKDFKERPASEAHLVARPVLAARPKPPRQPKEPKPVPAEQVEQWTEVPTGGTVRSDAVRPADTGPGKGQQTRQYGEKVAGLLGRIRPGAGQQSSKQGTVPRPEKERSVTAAGATAAGATAAGATAAGASSSPSATDGSSVPAAGAKSSTPARSKPDTSTRSTESSDPVESGTPVSDTAVSGTVTPEAAESEPVRTEPGSAEQETGGADSLPDAAVTETRTPLAETRAHTVIAESSPAVRQDPISATRDPEEEQVVEAFWFAVGTPKVVVDEHTGRAIFTLEPGDWEVGIEDRGSEFLVQDKRTGHVGVMRDLSNIERAPRD